MITLLSFMEKIYSDTKTLSMIYIIGSILLFIFIVMLIISLRKPVKKNAKIIEEPNIDEPKKETIVSETKIIEEPIIENKSEIKSTEESINEPNEVKIEENKEEAKQEKITEYKNEETNNKISAEIPSIDEFVDNIVNKTYEKNEQFSSVYVNTGTIKLEKVLDKLNVDEDIKEEIVPADEKVEKKEILEEPVVNEIKEDIKEQSVVTENKLDDLKNALEEKKEIQTNSLDKLDILKKTLEEKKSSINNKQDDLKSKLESLKTNNNNNKLDDLKNKLNNLKNQN